MKVKSYKDYEHLQNLPERCLTSPKALKWLDNCPNNMGALEWLNERVKWELQTLSKQYRTTQEITNALVKIFESKP